MLLFAALNLLSACEKPEVVLAERPSACISDEPEANAARAEIRTTDSYWTSMGGAFAIDVGTENHSSSGLFVITGTLENVSNTALRRVDLKFELLDGHGNTVYTELGVNGLAESDIMLSPAELAGKPAQEVAMLAPGASDTYRMIFIGSEVPKFARTRVTVIATR